MQDMQRACTAQLTGSDAGKKEGKHKSSRERSKHKHKSRSKESKASKADAEVLERILAPPRSRSPTPEAAKAPEQSAEVIRQLNERLAASKAAAAAAASGPRPVSEAPLDDRRGCPAALCCSDA